MANFSANTADEPHTERDARWGRWTWRGRQTMRSPPPDIIIRGRLRVMYTYPFWNRVFICQIKLLYTYLSVPPCKFIFEWLFFVPGYLLYCVCYSTGWMACPVLDLPRPRPHNIIIIDLGKASQWMSLHGKLMGARLVLVSCGIFSLTHYAQELLLYKGWNGWHGGTRPTTTECPN